MITGAHVILYSRDADADRSFFRDVLEYPHVDAGGGWLIFKLPPGEAAVHPADDPSHQLYLMCDDVAAPSSNSPPRVSPAAKSATKAGAC